MQSEVSALRIIGGKWRSRKISFISKGVRPTTNITRETVFNWLSPIIVESYCLDLFAGSGALGFEALSRGAKHVVMTDISIKVINKLKENADLLQAGESIEFYCIQVPEQLKKIPKQAFNIVFLDPPFHHGLIKSTCDKLLEGEYLAENSLVYVESEKELDINAVIPKSWQVLRKKTTGFVGSYLLQTG